MGTLVKVTMFSYESSFFRPQDRSTVCILSINGLKLMYGDRAFNATAGDYN